MMRYVITAPTAAVYDEMHQLLERFHQQPCLVNAKRLYAVVIDPSGDLIVRIQTIGCTVAPETQYDGDTSE